MHIISKKRVSDFYNIHPNSKRSLESWYKIVKNSTFTDFNNLRSTFPSADQVGKLTVFNISGNHIRLIAAIHYNRKKIYIRNIMTHEDYNKNKWKK